MLEKLGRFAVRRRRGILIGTLLIVIVASALGGGVFGRLSGGGFSDPNAENNDRQPTPNSSQETDTRS